MNASRTGGEILADQLLVHGADRVFGVPGESFLPILDGLYDRRSRLQFVTCRQEGGAAMMAEADGKLTGKPGICLVTRGPGAANATAGVHIAQQDSTPLILLVGQASRSMLGREAFQEIDVPQVFGSLAKWAARIDDPARIPELMARAFATATSGRPGPVVVSLPEDVLRERAEVADAKSSRSIGAAPGPEEMAALVSLMRQAKRPLAIIGGGCWSTAARVQLATFAERFDIPVAVSFRRQDYFDNQHPLYAGVLGLGMDPRLAQRVCDADLLLVIGSRLGEVPTNAYTLLEVPIPGQRLIHIYPDAGELGRVYQADLPIHADPRASVAALADLPEDALPRWSAWANEAHGDFRAFGEPVASVGAINMCRIIAALRDIVPRDSIVTNGAGNYTAWIHRFHTYAEYGTQLAPVSGSMGYGIPAAVAAKLRHPDRTVIAFAGDGCFLMTAQEFSTAVQYRANIVCVVVNNGMFGTIRMHQERAYPERISETDLCNPDFAALARAFGGHGETVERTDEFSAAMQRALDSTLPAIVELKVDPAQLTPNQTINQIRDSALSRR